MGAEMEVASLVGELERRRNLILEKRAFGVDIKAETVREQKTKRENEIAPGTHISSGGLISVSEHYEA